MFRVSLRPLTILLVVALAGLLTALDVRPEVGTAAAAAPTLLPGFTAKLFAGGTAAYSKPDSIEVDTYLHYIYVGYQNTTLPDGSDGGTSTIVQYNMDGSVYRTIPVPGHCDGLRVDPNNHLVWATSNEDANAVLTIINPVTGLTQVYTFPSPAPHMGGYDDMAFVGGKVYVAASNPTLNSAGVNPAPALDQMQPLPGGGIALQPVVMGNDSALDTTTKQMVTLNEVDPDSMTVDPQGDVVLDNQAGAELVFVHNPGSGQQYLTRIPLGTQVDDTVWATSSGGQLLVVDAKTNAIWQITGPFTPGTVYTEDPGDSGVAGFLGTIDLSTGTITPVGMGFGSPTGLAFIL